MRKITKMNPMLANLCYFAFIICMPFLAIIYILMPDSKARHYLAKIN